MTFGEWLKQTRAYHGLTLQEVADKAGITKSYAWDIERGLHNPTLNKAHQVTAVFGMELWRVLKKLDESSNA